MTAPTRTAVLPRTPVAIREWLSKHSPEDTARFEAEYQAGLQRAGQTYDLEAVEHTLQQWMAQIWGRTQQLSVDEIDLLRQFEATGDATLLIPHVA